ncbi:FdhF/YdeP family oxidoreductase [Schlesneria paludicola]|uniref:FdhF/YdeP family oxidoreductase n=1 Tax=Schlesneria paludicola TaxID=360056 RepID=UPI00029A4679|nr:FdhF/YdeP family oxidoreductase [Schlesneria paludicola]
MNGDTHPQNEDQRDENSAPNQRNVHSPKPIAAEEPTATPQVSLRTVDAQYPLGQDIPRITARDETAAGFHGVFESLKFSAFHGPMRSTRSLLSMNQKGGFDCPSCAWPDPDGNRNVAEFCENGAKAIAWESTSRRVDPEFFRAHSIADLASRTEQWLGDQGRITHPLVLRRGSQHYESIGWSDAFQMIADELNKLPSPDDALFYTSGRASNEAAFCYQLFIRQFGTNNLPDCSNMCHESSGLGLNESIGIGKGTVKLSDFDHADSIFIIGQNPGTNHPRMLSELEKAVRNGCQVVSINPLKETGMIRFQHPQSPRDMLGAGTTIASLFLPVRINGDVACLKGIMKEMLEADDRSGGQVFDRQFIDAKTTGFEAFLADLRATTWDEILNASGVSRELIRKAADIACNSKRMISCWAMGLTQHRNGVANVQTVTNFHLLRGQIGREGAGVCPVRGHSNVQGDRTMGIWEQMSDRFMEALGKEFQFSPPQKHGLDVVCGMQAMHEGKIGVFVGLGGNFLSAGPDTEYVADAFRRLKLSVFISTKLNRNHLITGEQSLILPCLGRSEQDNQASGPQIVSCENSMGVVQESRGRLRPASPTLMSETAIVCHLAKATLGTKSTVDWMGLCGNYDRIRDHIERVVPGFDDYNRRVREPGGFYLPNVPRDKQEFPTKTGKANFVVHPIPQWTLKSNELLMMSFRSHDQFNTTIYGQNDRYRGIAGGRRVIFMNQLDIDRLQFRSGQWVDLSSEYEGIRRHASQFMIVPYEIPAGCAATYYPESNPLVPLRQVAEGSNQPASKSIVITLAPAAKVPQANGQADGQLASVTSTHHGAHS